MNRQTVTLPRREFYDKVKNLKQEIKTPVIEAILDLFFEDKPIEYENLPENVGLVLACIVPDLRRVQTQFNNGKVQKNSEQTSQGLFCPLEPSQMKPIEAKQSQDDSSILNNNIYNNIYNTKIISNQSSEKNKTTPNTNEPEQSDPEKRKFFAESLNIQIERLKIEPIIYERMAKITKTLAKQNKPYKIKEELIQPELILEQLLDLFRTPDDTVILERISTVFGRVDSIKTNNKLNYSITSLYNEAKNL